jgi:spermidine synthase
MTRTYPSLLVVAFFLSGASALIYEILWQRQMMLSFGASAPAVTAILTAIFLGIALGSRAAPRLNRISGNPLVLYALVEASIGIWGFSVPWLLHAADVIYININHALGPADFWIKPLRFVLAIGVVLPATLCMGATVPLMVRLAGEISRGERSTGVAWAYGVNILGAVIGCLLAGFLFIRTIGLYHTREAAVAINALVMLLALSLVRLRPQIAGVRAETGTRAEPAGKAKVREAELPADLTRYAVLYFLAGFVALALEVIWLRFLGIINTNSNTTFSLALAVYLTGMGIGSLLVYPLLRRKLAPRSVFALGNLATAVGALLTFPMLYMAPGLTHDWILQQVSAGTLTLAAIIKTETVLSLGLMLLPTIFMGLAYPSVCDIIPVDAPQRKRLVGLLYFWGTLGSVLGTLITATWLLPAAGLHGAFASMVILLALIFVVARASDRQFPLHRLLSFVGAAVACLVAVWIAAEAVPVLRIARVESIGHEWWVVPEQKNAPPSVKLLHYKAGSTATVMVKEAVNPRNPRDERLTIRYCYVDDQLVASTDVEAKVDAVMLAHLPLLLHPAPHKALTVGFGSGGTSHALTTHPQVEAYCVEIEPEVPRAAHFFERQNLDVLTNPRFRLIINDARDHLHAGVETYDVISTDVTNLQYMQNGNLYSVEYFQMMKDKLNPGGIACAWIPMASVSNLELKILLASFQKVFPHTSLWHMNHTWTTFGILIGTPEKLVIDYNRLLEGFNDPDISQNLSQIGMTDPMQLIHCLQLDEVGVRSFVRGVPLHTDNLPILEFTSPLSFYQKDETFYINLQTTTELRPLSHLPFVVNLPEDERDSFEEHGVAARAFCDFMIDIYAERLVKESGPSALQQRLQLLRSAMQHAATGMQALPTDKVREYIYRGALGKLRELEALQH